MSGNSGSAVTFGSRRDGLTQGRTLEEIIAADPSKREPILKKLEVYLNKVDQKSTAIQ